MYVGQNALKFPLMWCVRIASSEESQKWCTLKWGNAGNFLGMSWQGEWGQCDVCRQIQNCWDAVSQYDRLHSASKVKPPPQYSEYKQFEKLQIKKKKKKKGNSGRQRWVLLWWRHLYMTCDHQCAPWINHPEPGGESKQLCIFTSNA